MPVPPKRRKKCEPADQCKLLGASGTATFNMSPEQIEMVAFPLMAFLDVQIDIVHCSKRELT